MEQFLFLHLPNRLVETLSGRYNTWFILFYLKTPSGLMRNPIFSYFALTRYPPFNQALLVQQSALVISLKVWKPLPRSTHQYCIVQHHQSRMHIAQPYTTLGIVGKPNTTLIVATQSYPYS